MITSVRPPARTAQQHILNEWFGKMAPTHYMHNNYEEVYVFLGDDGRYLLMASVATTTTDPEAPYEPLVPVGILYSYEQLMDYYRQGGYSWVH